MRSTIILALFLFTQAASACELLDATTAERVLGTAVVDATAEPTQFCMFISSTSPTQLSVRTDTREVYDQIMLAKPHAEVDIGERARSHKFPEGGAAVQFVAGDVSITLAVRTPAGDDGRDYLDLLIDVGRDIAAKLE